MILSIAIFAVAYIFIASEKVDKAVVAILGAGLMILSGASSFSFMLSKVDLNVFGLLIGMMIIVNIMGTTGVFEWIAVSIAKVTRGNGVMVMVLFMLATAVISAFMDNVTTVILMAPVTILICQLLQLPAIPMLAMEAIFSNIGGTATLVGDPPNILIGASCGLNFNDFILNLTPIVAIITVVSLAGVVFLLRRQLQSAPSAIRHVMLTEPRLAILDRRRLKRSLIVFALTLLGFFVGHTIHLEPGMIALCGAFAMILVCKIELNEMLEKVEWPTIMFFCGLFMMVGGLEENHVFERLGHWILGITNNDFTLTVMMILWSAAILSALVDNIPLVIAMIPLILGIIPTFVKLKYPEIDITPADVKVLLNGEVMATYLKHGAEAVADKVGNPEVLDVLTPDKLLYISRHISEPLLWSLALGACLGGNGTLIGASANVVISQIANKNKYPLTFMTFTKYGLPMMIVSVLLATVYLYFRYCV